MSFRTLRSSGITAAFGLAALWSGSASATLCVNLADDAYMTLTTNGSAVATCWDSGDQANPGQLPVSESGPGTFNDGILNLPTGLTNLVAKSDGANASFFYDVTGSTTGGLSGSFKVQATGSLALLFKSGTGQNDPSWWVYRLTGLAAGELISWTIAGTLPTNALSHISAYGGETTTRVPEPATSLLLGSGLILLSGLARRRTKQPAA